MWAFVSIQDPAWFSFQDAVNFLDLINEFFERRYRGGSRPTLEFYKVAYVKTMNVFLEAVSTHERKLSDIVKEVASWSSAWTSWDPPPVNNYGRGAGKGGDRTQAHVIPPHINRVMNRMGKMAMNMRTSMSKQSPYGHGRGQWQQGLWFKGSHGRVGGDEAGPIRPSAPAGRPPRAVRIPAP